MRISRRKKRKNKIKPLIISFIMLLSISIGGFLFFQKPTEENKGKTVISDYSNRYAKQVEVLEVTPLYKKTEKGFKPCGQIKKGTGLILDLETTKQTDKYYKIQGTEHYVKPEAIKIQNPVTYDQSYKRYVVFPENLISKEKTTLYDVSVKPLLKVDEKVTAPIYMKKDGMKFIEYNERLVGVKENEIETIEKNTTLVSENAPRIPVFMYHFFYDSQVGEKAKDSNYMEIHNFKDQLLYAKNNGYVSVTMKELNLYLDGVIQLPPKSFVITMDDNHESVKRLAYPILEETQTFATDFVVTSWVEDITPLKSGFVELQSHSDTMHQSKDKAKGIIGKFTEATYEEGLQDLRKASNKLDGATVLAYPFGKFNEQTKKITKDAGYVMAFTTQNGYVKPGMDKFALPRIRISTRINVDAFANLLD